MRALALVLLVLVALGAVGFVLFGRTASLMWLIYANTPAEPFAEADAPPPPDYGDPAAWAALPERADAADAVPEAMTPPDQERHAVDVFYVHPTTYFGRRWNQPLDEAGTNARTDAGPVRNQASAFSACCRVFAPRYRQATFAAFFDAEGNQEKALALAYGDVRSAFRAFIAGRSDGRPFMIASHSQGSRHALWLLEDEIEGTPLEARFVAAYIVGYAIPEDWFERRLERIGPCANGTDTGCVVTWSSYAEGGDVSWIRGAVHRYGDRFETNDGKTVLCTNPLNWTRDGGRAPASANIGGWIYGGRDGRPRAVEPGLTGARCEGGALFITPPEGAAWSSVVLPGRNYHNYDYQLFWMNIRRNAEKRAEAFLAR